MNVFKRVQGAFSQAVEQGQESGSSMLGGLASLTGFGNAADAEHATDGAAEDSSTPMLDSLEAREALTEEVPGWNLVLMTYRSGAIAEAAHAWEHNMETERDMLNFAKAHPEIVQSFLAYSDLAEEFVRRVGAGDAGHDMHADDIPLPELTGMLLHALSKGDLDQAKRLFYGLPGDDARMAFARENPDAIVALANTGDSVALEIEDRLHDEIHGPSARDEWWLEEVDDHPSDMPVRSHLDMATEVDDHPSDMPVRGHLDMVEEVDDHPSDMPIRRHLG